MVPLYDLLTKISQSK